MFETDQELDQLQSMFDAHLANANPHMLAIITPDRRLTARQVATYLQGTKHVAFATVTSKCEPRVSPLDSLFIHGRFTMGTGVEATKLRHLRRSPACSLVHVDGDRVAVAANGTVEWITREHPDHDEIHRVWTETYKSDPYSWGEIAFFRLQPVSMWAYASRPKEFPES
jgi:uncharacterized pyridoxamine 5'-phosphate oxidase family protein